MKSVVYIVPKQRKLTNKHKISLHPNLQDVVVLALVHALILIKMRHLNNDCQKHFVLCLILCHFRQRNNDSEEAALITQGRSLWVKK